jgi:zona occludens toxin (predicted ATPase)
VSVKQSSAYCHVCQRQSLFQKPRINHVLHLILSIVTFGFWLIVWAILGIINSSKSPRCTTCGSTVGAGAVYAPQQAAAITPAGAASTASTEDDPPQSPERPG